MRVTEKIVYDAVRNALMDNRDRLFTIQQRIAANRKILKPSDDPRAAEKLVYLTATQSEIDQFRRNITFGKAFIESSESVMSEAGDLLVRAKEIATQYADDVYTAQDRQMAATEVNELYDQLLGLANTKLGAEYIFSGFRSDAPAYDASGNYQGDDGIREVRIGQNEKLTLNIVGTDVFGTSSAGILRDLADLRDALAADDASGIRASLDDMDGGMQTVFRNQALLGARVRRLEFEEKTLENFGTELTGQISQAKDLDIAEAATELKLQEAAFEAAVQVSGRIASLTLLDVIGT
jgi:flagellar hook-associated protein 3 FlgL